MQIDSFSIDHTYLLAVKAARMASIIILAIAETFKKGFPWEPL